MKQKGKRHPAMSQTIKNKQSMEKQVIIKIVCDKGRVAESLRKLAQEVEESNEKTTFYEDAICCAELTEED